MIFRIVDRGGVGIHGRLGQHRPRRRGVAECARSGKDIGEGVARGLHL